MEKRNLLDFLHKVKYLHTYEYLTVCDDDLPNSLDLMDLDCDFLNEIDLGIIYLRNFTQVQFFVIDELGKLLSVSLLLHAICECYKKTTERNKAAIDTIRFKYLINKNQTKIRLNEDMQAIYNKIIYGERLTGKEKEHPIFVLFHKMWSRIKEDKLTASGIFSMLQKIVVTKIEINEIEPREVYYSLNKNKKKLNQLLLIKDFLMSKTSSSAWDDMVKIFDDKLIDLKSFLKDFIKGKFNYKKFEEAYLYEYFKNYFDTMCMYKTPIEVFDNIKKSAKLYIDLVNINIANEKIKKILIKIKMYDENDVISFIHGVYEEYVDGILSEATLIEILMTIEEHLKNRKNNPNNVGFDELIRYLNAFITYK